jgi:hypothetical protein
LVMSLFSSCRPPEGLMRAAIASSGT